jgi:hypothetical protein
LGSQPATIAESLWGGRRIAAGGFIPASMVNLWIVVRCNSRVPDSDSAGTKIAQKSTEKQLLASGVK